MRSDTTDEDSTYQAVRSRDARFDGAFFFAVTTTGTRCRPNCPAVTPEWRDVRFLRTAAAAHGSGETLRALAAALAAGEIPLDPGPDRDGAEKALLALPGIGPWTAGSVRMRALGDPEVLLEGDIAVRAGATRAGVPLEDAGGRGKPPRRTCGGARGEPRRDPGGRRGGNTTSGIPPEGAVRGRRTMADAVKGVRKGRDR